MLFEAPELDELELRILSEIDKLKGKLAWRFREPRRWYGSLRRIAFSRAIQGSNTIEGFSAELDDAAAIAVGEEPLDPNVETKLALEGYRNAMTYILQQAKETDFAYGEQLVKSLHFMMTGYDPLKNRSGLWRLGAAFVRNDQTGEIVYEGADIDEVPELMHELVETLNNPGDHDLLIHAAMAHLNLVMIHPFRDGNGRMARCLQSSVLARAGMIDPVFVSIEEYLGKNTPAYYDVLAVVGAGSWQPSQDARPWIRFNLTAHLRQAQTMLRRAKETELLWQRLEEIVESKGLPDRTIVPLFDAAMKLRVRNATYRAFFEGDDGEITEQTASRDLRHLVEADLLVAHGERRGRFYVASSTIAAVWMEIEAVRDPRDDSDPFASPA
jgi:Fic family protein